MSWSKVINLECDGGEYSCIGTPEHPEYEETVRGARATATEHGWRHKDDDLCPICIYVRKTGCTCDVNLYEKGEAARITDTQSVKYCEVHGPNAQRNPKRAEQ